MRRSSRARSNRETARASASPFLSALAVALAIPLPALAGETPFFPDGFESGDTCAWSVTVGGPQLEDACDGLDADCDGSTDEDASCGDGHSCTVDSCQGEKACKSVVSIDSCLIAGTCYTEGTPNPESPCERCEWNQSQISWTPFSCHDGLACTTDSCQDGGCSHALVAGSCLIDGACWADGAGNPSNACQKCDPEQSSNSWTSFVCNDGLACTSDFCQSGGGCGANVNPGTCAIDGACWSNGAGNPSVACQKCDTAQSQTSWTSYS